MTMDDTEPNIPQLLPEQRAGAALREAREGRGLSLREIAKRLGYNSHTTLSAYERGSVMPTEQVVEGYEQILGLTSGTLMSILEAACLERHGDAWTKRRAHIPVQFTPEESTSEVIETDESPARPWARRRRLFVGAVALILVVAAVIGTALWGSKPDDNAADPTSSPSLPQPPGSFDRTDPEVTGCDKDVVTADSVDVHDPPQHLAGQLQLRFSPSCGTSWARFEPTAGLATTPPLTLEINVRRPADNAVAPFKVAFDGLPAYGDMLMSNHECVYAELVLHRGNVVSPTFRTPCRRGRG